MNILISVNLQYLDKAKTMLFSLYKHSKETINVYLLNNSIDDLEIDKFRVFLKKKCKASLVVINANRFFTNYPLGYSHFSIEMYNRLVCQFLLPDNLDRILWLDADIIVLQNLDSFYYQDFEDKYYIVCRDRNYKSETIKEIKKNIGISNQHDYFNSGVLLINLKLLRKKVDFDTLLSKCNLVKNYLVFPDQDLLNYCYQNLVKYLEYKQYNYQLLSDKTIEKKDEDNIFILHYCGNEKPWLYQYINETSKYYYKYYFDRGERVACIRVLRSKMIEDFENYKCYLKILKYILFSI